MRITIDGNIGSGKTTQIKILQEKGLSVHPEPIHEWPLEKFYNDKKRWAFLMQMSVLSGFATKAFVYERSPDSSLKIFWEYMNDHSIVTQEENNTCTCMYSRYGWISDVFIYIHTPPDVCFDRVSKRFQDGDTGVYIEYLEELDMYYKKYIEQHPCVFVIDGTKSPEEIHKEILSIIKECTNDVTE